MDNKIYLVIIDDDSCDEQMRWYDIYSDAVHSFLNVIDEFYKNHNDIERDEIKIWKATQDDVFEYYGFTVYIKEVDKG
jgi:hypothetical protein